MQILEDVLTQLNKIDADNQAFKKLPPPKINLNSFEVAKEIKYNLPDYSGVVEELQKIKSEFSQFKNTIPKEVKVINEWRIERFTLLILAAFVLAAFAGWYGATTLQNVVQKNNNEKLYKLEKSIEEFKNKNPKTAEKYFE